ncbi:hypothetical protein CKAN_02775200 [Cinnamomum micranthum f. kanehirae]|uniref:Uncharacterized protein n=1 Tax=Cinnamomum micranthum f. kanehirae TaxID=337451 RepID=A0A443Q5E1_9MAGN|nr:hypothetical protein CKAN_02775200 [Cinnamomum micranthum f. kanehirae]
MIEQPEVPGIDPVYVQRQQQQCWQPMWQTRLMDDGSYGGSGPAMSGALMGRAMVVILQMDVVTLHMKLNGDGMDCGL